MSDDRLHGTWKKYFRYAKGKSGQGSADGWLTDGRQSFPYPDFAHLDILSALICPLALPFLNSEVLKLEPLAMNHCVSGIAPIVLSTISRGGKGQQQVHEVSEQHRGMFHSRWMPRHI